MIFATLQKSFPTEAGKITACLSTTDTRTESLQALAKNTADEIFATYETHSAPPAPANIRTEADNIIFDTNPQRPAPPGALLNPPSGVEAGGDSLTL